MSRRVDLPDHATVHRARDEVISAARNDGRKPTVLALARKLGMSNSTFWRHFPDTAQDLANTARATEPAPDEPTTPNRYDRLQAQHAKLKRAHSELEQDFERAKAVIQRLALDNHQLRLELEAATKVTRIDQRPRTD